MSTLSAPRTVSLKELVPENVIILVVGPTGSGKSSFISQASGIQDDIVGHDLVSKTSEILAVKYTDEESGLDIVLVDTPGLSNTLKDDSEVLRMFTEWSRKLKKRDLVISGILYFHRISDNRIPANPLRALCVFGEPCGGLGAALSKTILTITMWNDVGDEIGEKRLVELKSTFWKVVLKYMNDVESARELIREVIRSRGGQHQGAMPKQDIALTVQERSRQDLLKNLETLTERQLAILRNIDEESRNTSDPNAPASRGELEREYEKLRLQMDEAWRQLCQTNKWSSPPKTSTKRRFFAR